MGPSTASLSADFLESARLWSQLRKPNTADYNCAIHHGIKAMREEDLPGFFNAGMGVATAVQSD